MLDKINCNVSTTTYCICSSDDLYTEEDIQIMAGENSPSNETKSENPSTGSVAQFFAQACQQEQQQQEQGSLNQPNNKIRSEHRSSESEVQQCTVSTAKVEPAVNLMAHPPGSVLTGGPPGIRMPIPTTSGPIHGNVTLKI